MLALKERIARLNIDLKTIEERFIKGSGKGGQKINKTANTVQLAYPLLGITVTCGRERKRALNRFLALRDLVDKIEMRISPQTSEKLIEIQRIRKRKAHKNYKQKNANTTEEP